MAVSGTVTHCDPQSGKEPVKTSGDSLMTPKRIMPTRHWLITAFMLMLTSFISHPACAADEDQGKTALTHLYKAQINAFYAINSFYNFSANQADQAQMEAINEAVASVDESLNEL